MGEVTSLLYGIFMSAIATATKRSTTQMSFFKISLATLQLQGKLPFAANIKSICSPMLHQ